MSNALDVVGRSVLAEKSVGERSRGGRRHKPDPDPFRVTVFDEDPSPPGRVVPNARRRVDASPAGCWDPSPCQCSCSACRARARPWSSRSWPVIPRSERSGSGLISAGCSPEFAGHPLPPSHLFGGAVAWLRTAQARSILPSKQFGALRLRPQAASPTRCWGIFYTSASFTRLCPTRASSIPPATLSIHTFPFPLHTPFPLLAAIPGEPPTLLL